MECSVKEREPVLRIDDGAAEVQRRRRWTASLGGLGTEMETPEVRTGADSMAAGLK